MSNSNKPSGGRSLKHFVDILEPRRHGSDLAWVFRSMELTKAYDQLRSLSHPEVIKYNVLESEETASIIHEFSLELSLPKEQIRLQVLDILNEIGYGRSLTVVRWLGLLLVKILKKTRTSVYVNEEQLNKLRKQWGDNPVLFLPSHRSYGDFILMALFCFHYNIEIPCVAAGMDFHSMFLMGNMLRGCSAYFMRRTYGTDKLYWRVFDVYVQALVTSCVAPLEFFIEGTRSRTGKSLVKDLTIIPVSISYDRPLEESLFACELLGIPKPKESTSGFIKAVNTLNEQYGKICMDFADPISVRQFLASVNTQLHSNRELCLAHQVLRRQQNSSVISPFNVLSILLSHHYIHRPHLHSPSPPVVLTQATSFLTWFSGILENFGALVDIPKENVPFALEDCLEVHKSLVHISRDENTREKVLCVTPTRMNVTAIDSSKLKGHILMDSTIKDSVAWMSIQNYSNPCLSFIIDAATICILLLRSSSPKDKETLFKEYIQIRLLFKYEFVFYLPLAEELFSTALSHLYTLDIVKDSSSTLTLTQSEDSQYLCSIFVSMLYPYIVGYHVACSSVGEHEEKPLVKKIQRQAELTLLSDARHPYILSLDLISCCLSALTDLKALTRVKTDKNVIYNAHVNVLQGFHDDLNKLRDTVVKQIANHSKVNSLALGKSKL
ncbi:hypothetical protein M8J75_006390 [Diaphorina citri]|nr:hypothetical protein M8J75_006390 [Diaphorina citri]